MRRSPSSTSASYTSRGRTTLWQIAPVDGPTPRARLGWTYPAMETPRETEEAKRIIEMEKAMEQEGVKWFVVMANRTDLAQVPGRPRPSFSRGNPRAMDGGPC